MRAAEERAPAAEGAVPVDDGPGLVGLRFDLDTLIEVAQNLLPLSLLHPPASELDAPATHPHQPEPDHVL